MWLNCGQALMLLAVMTQWQSTCGIPTLPAKNCPTEGVTVAPPGMTLPNCTKISTQYMLGDLADSWERCQDKLCDNLHEANMVDIFEHHDDSDENHPNIHCHLYNCPTPDPDCSTYVNIADLPSGEYGVTYHTGPARECADADSFDCTCFIRGDPLASLFNLNYQMVMPNMDSDNTYLYSVSAYTDADIPADFGCHYFFEMDLEVDATAKTAYIETIYFQMPDTGEIVLIHSDASLELYDGMSYTPLTLDPSGYYNHSSGTFDIFFTEIGGRNVTKLWYNHDSADFDCLTMITYNHGRVNQFHPSQRFISIEIPHIEFSTDSLENTQINGLCGACGGPPNWMDLSHEEYTALHLIP